jgi:hypothetical protein
MVRKREHDVEKKDLPMVVRKEGGRDRGARGQVKVCSAKRSLVKAMQRYR